MSSSKKIVAHNPSYEVVIGIEVHVQLNTNTKIFCGCSIARTAEPNKNICPICTAQPGSLPVVNKEVITSAIAAGLATNCTVSTHSVFARKHYFYPDLPKNYQITQNDKPICTGGFIDIRQEDGSIKRIRITRIHMEEDAGKNIHAAHSNESYVDLNRAGTPLLEIVSEPDISSAYEAKEYLKTLRSIIQYLGISTVNMQEGAFRADTNISLRKVGAPKLGTRVELKNINSFKFIGDAIGYEIERHIELLEDGKAITQETRLWDTKEGVTKIMRSKEEAADYRYCDDPDLPPVILTAQQIDAVKASLPELPQVKFERYTKEHGLSAAEADIIINDPELCLYYQAAYESAGSKGVINLILRNLLSFMKENTRTFESLLITPQKLGAIVTLIENNTINSNAAQEVFALVAATGKDPHEIVKTHGLEQMGNSQELESVIQKVLEHNPTQLSEYKAGKHKLMSFFVGKAMQETKGKANPVLLQEILSKLLA